jgi:hypothetical protein
MILLPILDESFGMKAFMSIVNGTPFRDRGHMDRRSKPLVAVQCLGCPL